LNLIITIYFYFLPNFQNYNYTDIKSVILVFPINVSVEFKIQTLFFVLIYELAKIQKNLDVHSLPDFFLKSLYIKAKFDFSTSYQQMFIFLSFSHLQKSS